MLERAADDCCPRFARLQVRWSTEHGSFTQAVAAATAANRRGVPTVRLQACIDQFLAEEVLKEEEKWYCSACKEFRRARKKFDFWRLPSILIVHLKRFQHFNRRKLRTVVEFPVDEALDLGAYVKGPQSESAQYDLFAVSNHMGDLGASANFSACLYCPLTICDGFCCSVIFSHRDSLSIVRVCATILFLLVLILIFALSCHLSHTQAAAITLRTRKTS